MHVTGCEGPGCFTFSVNYEASLEQITKLMDISLACEQFIRYDCYDSKLLKDGETVALHAELAGCL